ncbi:MAG: hypothetical protein IJ523_03800 [Succinivibrionaceae bacterium]|nr:hypothetical protein [Succinivibrionaceae bacterium]
MNTMMIEPQKSGVCKLAALAVAVSLTFGAAGCSNIQDDGTRTKTEGTLVGTGIGAGVGALLGGLIGGNGKGALIGAGIGAGIGALSGFFVGKHIADKKAEYASREDWLDDCIAHSREVTKETKTYNAQLQKDINTLDKESKTLTASYKKKKVSADQLTARNKDVKELKKSNEENIKNLEEEVKKQKEILADAKKNGNTREAKILDNEIKSLNSEIAKMKQYNQKLAGISSRLAV